MKRAIQAATVFVWMVTVPLVASAEGLFVKTGYYVALGDSVAAGEGALPVTNGYVYQLYERSIFGRIPQMHLANVALRGARSWEVLEHQVPQVLCTEPSLRPTVVTITGGANDFFRGDLDIFSIAQRMVESINRLLNNNRPTAGAPVLDPVTQRPCRALEGVTILVSNYYAIPHPDPAIAAQFDQALRGFDQALRFWLQHLQVPPGSRVAVVDLYSATLGRTGLVRGFGKRGTAANYDIHPTNLGHLVIAKEFADAWNSLE